MSKALLFETELVLRNLKSIRKSVDEACRSLTRFDSCSLVNSYSKGAANQHYYLKKRGVPGKHYLGKNNAEIIKNIKAARYYKKLKQVIDKDISILESVSQNYIVPDPAAINDLLPKVYQSEAPPLMGADNETAAEWKKRMEAEKAKYEPYMPENLVHMAQDGTMMRSHSEVLIANYLLSLGITFVYELPLIHHGKMIWPDFTILSPIDNKTVIIIEHQGAMESEEYQSKFIKSLLFYLATKLVPNKDVFFTFNHLNRNLDLRQIDYILHIAFGYNSPHSYGMAK